MRRRLVVMVVSAAAVLAAATACAVPIADLGGDSSSAAGINDAGVVVGTSTTPGGEDGQAFKRLPDDTVVELELLAGATRSQAARINDDGIVVGTAYPPVNTRAVYWDLDGHVHDLGPGEAHDINDDGIIVGGSGGQGFAFDLATGARTAMPDPPGTSGSVARGINNEGEVVGWADLDSFVPIPVRWDLATGEVVDLSETLSTPWFFPVDINDGGTMIGFASLASDGDPSEAVVVLAGSDVVLPLGAGEWSTAHSLNEANTVVGYAGPDAHPFRWQPDTGLVTLGEAGGAADVNESGSIVGHANGRAAFLSFGSAP